MLLPESMSRIVIVGTKARLPDAINAFYDEKALHVIDHTTGDDGLSIGTPVEGTSKASERLLKVKAMEKELGIKKKTKTANIAVEDVRQRISDGDVESVEDEVLKAVDARNDLTQTIAELNAKKKIFETLEPLPLTLDMYSGYRSLDVIVGTVSANPSKLEIADSEIFSSFAKKKGGVVAVFVKKGGKNAAADALAPYGFAEITVPVTTEAVTPADAAARLQAEIDSKTSELEAVGLDLEALKEKYKSFLKGSDEELSIAVEKGSVPLRIAVSKYAYVMDAWVPTKKTDAVKADLEQKLGDDIYVEFQETRGRSLDESEKAEPRFQKVPTKQNNGRIVSEFEYATSMVDVPRYQEVDPTVLLAIFLPLFFGYMIGDLGYSIPFIIIGAYGLKYAKNKDWRSIGLVLFFGGIWGAIFGTFYYGEMLGMHFVGGGYLDDGTWQWYEGSAALTNAETGERGTTMSWDWILGVTFPEWFYDMLPNVGPSWETFSGEGVSKLEDIGFMLKMSVYIGIVHLFIGHATGYYNLSMQHGGKYAFIHKGGLILLFFGMIFLCYGLTDFMFNDAKLTEPGPAMDTLVIGIVLLIVGVIVDGKGSGVMTAVMAIPEIIGQILSYTRLAAIAMSKAGMALAFNYIIFLMIIPKGDVLGTQVIDGVTYNIAGLDWTANIAFLIIAILMFGFLHLVVWTLGILSAGLHALRLQYVELMMRFFDGGGVRFAPLSEKRVKTFFSKQTSINTKEI